MVDLLECLVARVLLKSSVGSAVFGVMANLSTIEATSFSHAFSMILWS